MSDQPKATAYDVYGYNLQPDGSKSSSDTPIKFPHQTPKSTLTLLRFVGPNRKYPTGQIIAKGHPPFAPEVIGYHIVARA